MLNEFSVVERKGKYNICKNKGKCRTKGNKEKTLSRCRKRQLLLDEVSISGDTARQSGVLAEYVKNSPLEGIQSLSESRGQ